MIYVKVQYDAYNRTFKLVDRDLGRLLEDYALYDLALPFILEDGEQEVSFMAIDPAMAHAEGLASCLRMACNAFRLSAVVVG